MSNLSTKIGIIGCGAISGIYLKNFSKFGEARVHAVSDLDIDRARACAAEYGVPLAALPEEILSNHEIDVILNLTVPKAHYEIALSAVDAGKHVYNEKPLCLDVEQADELLKAAARKNVLVGCAPDTFMGRAHQTCRRLIDEGVIGTPVAAQAFMLCRGHESWHPSPEFYYERGGGPMLDMGPYYITALVNMLGPVRRVTGSTSASFMTRTITSQPKAGKVVEVETPTHLSGEMDFESGAIAHITTTFDVYSADLPNIVVYGSEGTLIVPDPNSFDGEIKLSLRGKPFEVVPPDSGFSGNWRGIGALDMVLASSQGRTDHRASGELARHALEVMQAFERSSTEERHLHIQSTVKKPQPVTNEFAPSLNRE